MPPWSSFQRMGSRRWILPLFHRNTEIIGTFTSPLYAEYQQFLHGTIVEFRKKEWTFKQIAKWLNEKGYQTAHSKKFHVNLVFSIYKKKRLRDERLCSIPENGFEIGPLSIEYVERKHINSIWPDSFKWNLNPKTITCDTRVHFVPRTHKRVHSSKIRVRWSPSLFNLPVKWTTTLQFWGWGVFLRHLIEFID